jgi:hypothetical protein
MECAVVYKRGRTFFFGACCRTTEGVWIDSPPFLALDAGASADAVGEAVARVLAGSTTGVRHPLPEEVVGAELLHLAGARSHSAFERGAVCANVERGSDALRFTPTRSLAKKGGFVPNLDDAFALPPDAPAEDVGAATLRALELSR